jgi:hypothetical protein
MAVGAAVRGWGEEGGDLVHRTDAAATTTTAPNDGGNGDGGGGGGGGGIRGLQFISTCDFPPPWPRYLPSLPGIRSTFWRAFSPVEFAFRQIDGYDRNIATTSSALIYGPIIR